MRLIEAVLRGFKHFPLSDIQTLCYKPTVKTQVILGSNGSGKTTLMKELSPLAGKKVNYEAGGSKEVTYLYKGSLYELKSIFTETGAQFYFIKDGENLNHGLLVSGYTALVEEVFGYTEKKHRLFMGKQRLTTMSVNDRRQWFTDMHGVDYGYAMRYHKKMKERIKELTVAIKVTEERIQTEEARKLSPDAIQALEHDAVKRRNEVRRMISARPGSTQGLKNMATASYSLQNTMMELEGLLKTLSASPYLLSLKTKRDAEASIRDFATAIAKAEGLQASLYRQLEEKQKLSAICNQSNTTQLNALKIQRKELAEKLDILTTRALKDPITEISDLAAAEHIFANSEFIDTVARYSEELNAIERPNKYASYDDANRHLAALQVDASKTNSLLTRAKEHLAVLDEAAKRSAINCVKCGHSWRDGYDESKHQQVKLAVEHHAAELKLLTDAVTAAEAAVQAFSRTVQINAMLGQLASSTKTLVGFWSRFGRVNPRTAFETVKVSYYEQVQITYLQKQITELDERIRSGEAIVAQLKDEDVKKVEEDLKTLDLQLSNLTAAIRNDRIILSEQMSYHRTLEAIERLNETMTMDLDELNRIGQSEIRRQMSLLIDDLIHQDNAVLTELEREITQARSRDALIKELRDEVDRKKIEKALLVEAEEALSPATGLIAKGMMEFVNSFIDEVNEMISAVWSYPMELGHVRIDEEDGAELDYNFEIKVMGKPKAPDVEDASSGMQEIIDLAFVVISMQRQGFGDYPLFLDEFAARMDEKHRSSAYKIVEYLCDSTEFSNIFLTSHYQAGYSNLSNAEILVLHASNLEIPKHLKTNQHVVIT